MDRAVEVRVLPGRRLNNFAIELADFRRLPGKAKQRFTFENPRDGWIYVRLEADAPQGDDRLWLTLDSEDESQAVIVAPATETTRRLPAGPHFLVLGRRGKPRVTRLTVRAVPEIIYASYRYDPRIGREFGVFDWDFLNRYVLPHVNTINGPIGLSAELAARHAAEWRRRGGRCVRDTGLPHLDTSGPMPTVDGTCQALTEALSPPHLDAILADECILAPVYHERNLVYAEAFARLAADPGLKGKQIYPYIAGQWLGGRGFLRRIAELPWPMVEEYYCIERKTEAEAATHVADHAETYLRMLREIMDEPQRRALFALFYETLSPCSA